LTTVNVPSPGGGFELEMETLLNSAIGVGAGLYLGAVVIRGNVKALGTQLEGEEGYLEFMVTLFILSFLASFGPTAKITQWMIVLALVGLALRFAMDASNATDAIKAFGAGQIGLFAAVKAIVTNTAVQETV
jgi:hypothetical protein